MTAQQAAARWQKRQLQTLTNAYLAGWRTGVQNYRTQSATPPAQQTGQPAPTKPAAAPMSRALAPALQSLARMAAQIATLVPTAAQLAASGTMAAALALALRTYLKRNAWLLAAGLSVAWAAEQAGYAQAASADGLMLDWQLDPNPTVEHCADCPALAALPPMPLAMWPTLPGEGATDCNVGCKCAVKAVAAPAPVLTHEQQELVNRIANRQPVLIHA